MKHEISHKRKLRSQVQPLPSGNWSELVEAMKSAMQAYKDTLVRNAVESPEIASGRVSRAVWATKVSLYAMGEKRPDKPLVITPGAFLPSGKMGIWEYAGSEFLEAA